MLLFAVVSGRQAPIESKFLPFVSSITKITKNMPSMHMLLIRNRQLYIPMAWVIIGKYLVVRKEAEVKANVLINMPSVRIWKRNTNQTHFIYLASKLKFTFAGSTSTVHIEDSGTIPIVAMNTINDRLINGTQLNIDKS